MQIRGVVAMLAKVKKHVPLLFLWRPIEFIWNSHVLILATLIMPGWVRITTI